MKEKIFTVRQVLLASVFGGPFGGAYAVSRNLAAVNSLDNLSLIVFLGWIPSVIYVIAFPYLPLALSLGVVPIVFCAAVYFIAAHTKTERLLVQMGRNFEYYRVEEVARMAIIAFTLFVAAELVWFLVVADFFKA